MIHFTCAAAGDEGEAEQEWGEGRGQDLQAAIGLCSVGTEAEGDIGTQRSWRQDWWCCAFPTEKTPGTGRGRDSVVQSL